MRLLRRITRLLRLLPHVGRGAWDCVTRLSGDHPPRTEREWETVRRWFRKAMRIVGVDIHVHGQVPDGPVLFVANHVSWLDIGVLDTIIDAGFIGKDELRRWPVLGFLIARGGTVFIKRGGNGAAANATSEMTARLARGDRVAVFPEGTTTPGDDVRNFHPRLFEAARTADVPIQPVAIRYDSPAAPMVDDDQSFLAHVWRLLGERRIRADIWMLPPIVPGGRDRRALSREAQAMIREKVLETAEQVPEAVEQQL